jgi:hypothetical protein
MALIECATQSYSDKEFDHQVHSSFFHYFQCSN